jgi:hypothetical protein
MESIYSVSSWQRKSVIGTTRLLFFVLGVDTEDVIVEEEIDPVPESSREMKTENVIENISSRDMFPGDEQLVAPESVIQGEADIVIAVDDAIVDMQQNTVEETRELPKTLGECQRLLLPEKAKCFPFERFTDDKAFNYFMNYLTEIGSNMGFSEAYDEFAEISQLRKDTGRKTG